MSRKKKKRQPHKFDNAELNVMPFIDVFSVLTTFLLMVAVFVSVGMHEIQVPFLSSAVEKDKTAPTRSISLNMEVEKDKIILRTEWSLTPKDPQKYEYDLNEAGLGELHKQLVDIRSRAPKTDLISMFVDDDVIYDSLNKVLDVVKLRNADDPAFENEMSEDESGDLSEKRLKAKKELLGKMLYPKVVFQSVVL